MTRFNGKKGSLAIVAVFLLTIAFVSVLGMVQKCHAFDLTITGNQVMLESKNLDPSRGITLEAGDRWRVLLSFEDTLLRFGGEEACDVSLYGMAIMRRFQIGGLALDLGAGYFIPQVERRLAFREALWLEINHLYPEGAHIDFDDPDIYEYELHGNFGGFFRVSYEQYLTKRIALSLGGGYRYLKLQESLTRDHRAYCPGSWVEFGRWQDLGGGFVTLGLAFHF